jgi:hypothetical protein
MNWYKQIKISYTRAKQWDQETLDRIGQLFLEGNNISQVAKIMNIPRTTLTSLNKKYKWKESRVFSQDELDTIGELISEGNSLTEIANMLNIPRSTLSWMRGKYNWESFDEQKRKWWKQLADSYLEGLSFDDVAAKFNTTNISVRNALIFLGLKDKIRSQSEISKQKWQDEDFRNKMMEYHGSDENRKRVSEWSKKNWQNPEMRKRLTDAPTQWWAERGGLEGYLTSIPKEQAITYLNGLVARKHTENPDMAFAIKNKYMQIIERANSEPQLPTI